jgi:DNA invertase Pin-like site-specific DNA recombinase
MRAMREYAARRGWAITFQIKEVDSGAVERELREQLLAAARRREIDVVLVWRLDRWGRSLVDLVVTLKELASLGVGFVSLTEALDLTTPTGRAMAGWLSVFAEFERHPPRANPRRYCRSPAQRKAPRSASDGGEKGKPNPETSPRRRQQSPDRPPTKHRPHLRASNPRHIFPEEIG